MCALFLRFREVMDLKNQTFAKKDMADRAKKLDVVLRQLTGDAITKEQRQCLQYALGHRRQFRLQLCTTGCDFKNAVFPELTKECGERRVKMLLGKESGLMAALVSCHPPEMGDSTVYLYLPKSKEAMCDAMQGEEKKEA